MDRIRHMATRTASPSTSITTPVRTANFHYAEMRCAERTARSLSTQHSAHVVLGNLAGIPWEQVTEVAAARDSYYLLAAAHRHAGQRRERAERRALAWSDFKKDPVRELWWMAGDKVRWGQRKTSRLVRSIRRAVSV